MGREVLCSSIAALLVASGAHADTIASYTRHFSFENAASVGMSTGMRFDLFFKNSPPGVSGWGTERQFLFGGTSDLTAGLVLTEDDVGRTFVADASAPGFAWAAGLLTNGAQDTIGWIMGAAPASTAFLWDVEDYWFFDVMAEFDGPGPDLIGFDVTAITFTVVSLDLHLSTWMTAVGDIQIDFIGTPVPEPESNLLCLVALGTLLVLTRSKSFD